MSYRFDPELETWLEGLPTFPIDDLPRWRATLRDFVTANPGTGLTTSSLHFEERTFENSLDGSICRVRLYYPVGRSAFSPAVLFIHGGGFILGDLDSDGWMAEAISAEAEVVVISVDYRLAPEHPFPAALDDCYAALLWTFANGDELGLDSARVAISGNSAGAGLAAGVALRARDMGGPHLCFQYLGIPELDDRLTSDSMRAYHDTPVWNRPQAELSWKCYLGPKAGGPDVSPYAAPARAQTLEGLPPTFVSVDQFDPLRDEGIEFARRLMQAGVFTELHAYPGTFHAASAVQDSSIGRRILADQINALRSTFGLPLIRKAVA